MSKENDFANIKLSSGGIIAPIVTLVLLFVFWRLGQKWVALPALVLLIFFYLLMPKLVRNRAKKFHNRALKLLSTGNASKIPKLARNQIILQLFGPSGPIDAKLGMAYIQMGDYNMAAGCLQNGISSAPDSEKPALQASLAKSLFVMGDPARAEVEGRNVLNKGTLIPELLVIVARSRVALGKIDNTTMQFLHKARELSLDDDVKLMIDLTLIEMAVATGRKHDHIPENADSKQLFLRTWIHYVRGILREKRGDLSMAAESYGKAVKTGKEENCWFADLAHERLQVIAAKEPQASDNNTEIDPTLRRKKRKRR